MVSTKEIAKQIRQDLKSIKGYKFSVTIETYSGGSSISIDVMSSPIRMIREMSEISDRALLETHNKSRYTRIAITQMQAEKYHQLNPYQLRTLDEYDENVWNNGVFLTKAGHEDLRKVVAIVEKYRKDSSDISIDYFNCNFYFHLSLGKWDKPFIDGI